MRPDTARNVFWAGTEAATSGVLSLASAAIVARLIGPSEFGIAAAAVAPHVLLWVAVNALFADAVVQRSVLDDTAACSAFWSSTVAGMLAALLLAAAGWPIAHGMADTRLLPMCLLLAAPLPLVGAAGMVQGLLTRRRAYRALAGRTIVGQGLGIAVGIAAALHGAGAWAPVMQQAATAATGALTLLVRASWRPSAIWRWQPTRELLRVGLPLTAGTVLLTARYRVFTLLLGGTAGAVVLGQTHMAFRLVETVRELCSTALWRLMLPILSEHQDDVPVLRATVDRLLAHSSVVTLPLCGAMALLLPGTVRLVLGPAWSAAGAAAEPLVALMALLLLMFPSGVAVIARGRSQLVLLCHLASFLVTLAMVPLFQPGTAPQAAIAWLGAQLLTMPYLLWVSGDAIGAGLLRPLRAARRMLLATAVGWLLAWAMPSGLGGPIGSMALRLGSFMLATALCLLLMALGGGLPLVAGWTSGGQRWHDAPTVRSALRGIDAHLRLWLRSLRPIQREPPDGGV